MRQTWLSAALPVLLCACSQNPHTIESTQHLSQEELAALCEDLRMRADMDCLWNMKEQQSSVANQQTWEINCRARRDSARESYDNVCQGWRFQPQPPKDEDVR
jgi:hypothetical protein